MVWVSPYRTLLSPVLPSIIRSSAVCSFIVFCAAQLLSFIHPLSVIIVESHNVHPTEAVCPGWTTREQVARS